MVLSERIETVALWITKQKLSDRAREDLKNVPSRIRENMSRAEQQGLKFHGMYLTTGDEDIVAIVEAPDDEVALTALLQVNAGGGGATSTARAFTLDEFEAAAARLP